MIKNHYRLMNEQGNEGGDSGTGSPPAPVTPPEAPSVAAQIEAAVNAAVTGLKNKNGELIGLLKTAKDSLQQFDGIDVTAMRAVMANFANAEEAALIKDGKVDQVIENRTARMKVGFEEAAQAVRAERDASEATVARFSKRVLNDSIRAEAALAGIHSFAVEDAIYRASTVFGVDGEGNPTASSGTLGKDGNALTLKEWFSGTKESSPHWYPATGTTGSGSSGSNVASSTPRFVSSSDKAAIGANLEAIAKGLVKVN